MIELVISGFFLLLLDGGYITSQWRTYQKVIEKIQGKGLQWRSILPILACYTCLIGGLYYFILHEKRSIYDAFWFGIVIYGVYATTIYTMFEHYPAYLAIIDILWGGILMAITTVATRMVLQNKF